MKSTVFLLLAIFCSARPAPATPRSFAYVLQADAFAPTRAEAVRRLAECGRDWIVLDLSFDSGPRGPWTPAEICTIRDGQPGRLLLAYISIGEAEDYRAYWDPAWNTRRDSAPTWLGAENPDWKGNYAVRYWQNDWQQLVLRQVDDALSAGFDGIYLDLVDAFELFERGSGKDEWIDHRPNPETGRTYRQDMVAWVFRIAEHARQRKPGFLVVPQNGVQLLADVAFRKTIDAIGVEDLFTAGNRPQSREHIAHTLGFLSPLSSNQKPVLLIEYGTRPDIIKRSRQGSKEQGFLLLLTDRDLKTLGSSDASEPF